MKNWSSNTIRYQSEYNSMPIVIVFEFVSNCIRIGIELYLNRSRIVFDLVSNCICIDIESCSNSIRIVFEVQFWKLNPDEIHSGLYVQDMAVNTNPILLL